MRLLWAMAAGRRGRGGDMAPPTGRHVIPCHPMVAAWQRMVFGEDGPEAPDGEAAMTARKLRSGGFRHMDGRWEAAPLDGPGGTSDQGLPALQLAAAPRTDGRVGGVSVTAPHRAAFVAGDVVCSFAVVSPLALKEADGRHVLSPPLQCPGALGPPSRVVSPPATATRTTRPPVRLAKVESESEPEPEPNSRFALLPAELRLKIWACAAEPRVVILDDLVHRERAYPLPAVTQLNAESRAESRRGYEPAGRGSYVDFSRDIVVCDASISDQKEGGARTLEALAPRVRRLAFWDCFPDDGRVDGLPLYSAYLAACYNNNHNPQYQQTGQGQEGAGEEGGEPGVAVGRVAFDRLWFPNLEDLWIVKVGEVDRSWELGPVAVDRSVPSDVRARRTARQFRYWVDDGVVEMASLDLDESETKAVLRHGRCGKPDCRELNRGRPTMVSKVVFMDGRYGDSGDGDDDDDGHDGERRRRRRWQRREGRAERSPSASASSSAASASASSSAASASESASASAQGQAKGCSDWRRIRPWSTAGDPDAGADGNGNGSGHKDTAENRMRWIIVERILTFSLRWEGSGEVEDGDHHGGGGGGGGSDDDNAGRAARGGRLASEVASVPTCSRLQGGSRLQSRRPGRQGARDPIFRQGPRPRAPPPPPPPASPQIEGPNGAGVPGPEGKVRGRDGGGGGACSWSYRFEWGASPVVGMEMSAGRNCGIKRVYTQRRCTIAIQSFETSLLPVFNFASGLGHALERTLTQGGLAEKQQTTRALQNPVVSPLADTTDAATAPLLLQPRSTAAATSATATASDTARLIATSSSSSSVHAHAHTPTPRHGVQFTDRHKSCRPRLSSVSFARRSQSSGISTLSFPPSPLSASSASASLPFLAARVSPRASSSSSSPPLPPPPQLKQHSRTITITATSSSTTTNTAAAATMTTSQVPNGTAGSKTSSSGGGGITSRDKLLIHAPQPPPPGFLDLLGARFPQLSVRWELARLDPVRSDLASADTLPAEVLDGVTMLSVYPPAKAAAIPDVRFVQLISAGSDRWVGHEKYRDPGVVFCSGSGCHAPQIAEWVMASWLASEHHFDIYKQQQLQGSWSARVADHPVTDSMGRRMAVFGYGSIGRQCAHLGRALGMDVVAYTQRPRPTPASRRLDPGSYAVPGTGDPDGAIPSRWFHGDDAPAALADMLRLGVDLLVLAVPLSDSTRGLVGRREFDLMREVTASANGGGDPSKRRRPPFLCNIARGPVVDSLALVDALRDGSVRGAALDVTDPEPLPADHPLWTAPNVFITPHVSWQSTAIIDRITDLILENLTRLDEGRPLLNQIKK
ncbi:hypothetical protein PCL_00256 [Purpureocillium lilacinum]|uniref:D-isomer specific 2-hydroxyacid dehydrogenase NAD-binding domain-containing protein n=1 Tax=Purpureocillium lilacinum TaxID=33203 RepID=A0A2U3E6H7_PURLI|nr:hypothetical protein PCL_00256 [Purpureocillium lilacinum]